MNFLPVKRNLLKYIMPIYQYQVVNGQKAVELFEVEQGIQDPPLTKHPITLEPVRRILSSPSLSLSHTTRLENKSLASENLQKNGFSQYKKDSSSGDYFKTAGNQGPDQISHDDIHNSAQ